MNVLLKKRITRYLTVLATITFITACSTTTPEPEDIPPALFSELEADSAFYLNKDDQLGSEENLTWQFLAIQALIKEKKFVMADAVIESLQANPLSAEQTATLGLLIADKFYAQNKLAETQDALNKVDTTQLIQAEHVHYLKLQVALHIRNELPLEASDGLLQLMPLLTNDVEKQTYAELLFAQLGLLPYEQLNQYQTNAAQTSVALPEENNQESNKDTATDNTETAVEPTQEISTETVTSAEPADSTQINKEGWYALAALYQQNKLRPNRLKRAFTQWEMTYANHPALSFLPLALTDIPEFSPYQPDNIAVLLPLSGRFEKQGKAIQLGLLNAYYHQLNAQQKNTSASDSTEPETETTQPKLHFFDTQTTNAQQLAQQLKAAKVDFVVGPLMKREIEALLPLIEELPVLALNSFAEKIKPVETLTADEKFNDANIENNIEAELENNQVADGIAWHYAFPLSPEDEAQQAATMIHSDQHKNPLIIVPDSSYGKRVAKAFSEQWAALTPESDVQVEAHYFTSKAKLNTFIDDVLHTDKSKRRISQMEAIAKIKLETEVRSRRDIDAIYIVSKRDELILLKPFIDVSVSPFAKKIPLYASSRSHSVDRNNTQNKELSRLVFSDNAFLLDQDSDFNKEVQQAWKKQSFSTLRLFALGYDSYQLIEQLMFLQDNNDALYNGLIGELNLDSNNTIQAKLSWAKYQNGALFEVASPVTTE